MEKPRGRTIVDQKTGLRNEPCRFLIVRLMGYGVMIADKPVVILHHILAHSLYLASESLLPRKIFNYILQNAA
jgi:hypothetical protein